MSLKNIHFILVRPQIGENIGAVAFLSRYGNLMLEKMIGGYVLNCIGHGEEFSYKKSRFL